MNSKQPTNNYARNLVTGEHVFFADSNAPVFERPQFWAFFRVPKGMHPDTFKGRLVGVNPAEPEPVEQAEGS